jgi:tRNA dimethylallyltransferase
MNSNAPFVICIMGPTASGKTDLALQLAKHTSAEIINVDSAQIYQGMDIGSGKPNAQERGLIAHHLMDFLDPAIAYSAAQFRLDAISCIKDILARKRLPILVGGTMLYFKVLQHGIAELPDKDIEIRSRLDEMIRTKGLAELYAKLKDIDPTTASRISPTDPQRITRALEIYEITGMPMSHWLKQSPSQETLPYQFLNIGLIPIETERSILHQRIEQRFDNMLAQGLLEEVKRLYQREDLNESLPAIRSVGYRQVWRHFKGEYTFEEMREKSIAATRQLAKRQLTWLRSWPNLKAFDFADNHLLQNVTTYLKNQGVQFNND